MKAFNKFYIIYYALLLVVLASRQSTEAPTMVLRIVYMAAVLVPCLFTKQISYPAIITLYYTLTIYGFSFSYMPYTLSLYAIISIAIVIFFANNKKNSLKPPKYLILIALYILFVNGINTMILKNAQPLVNTFWGFVLLICCFSMADANVDNTQKQLSVCFEIAAIILSVYFLVNRQQFAVSYGREGLERTVWVDPNYFGMVIGMGTICGLIRLFDNKRRTQNFLEKALSIAVVVFTVPVLLLNASRGAVLAVVVAGSILFITSKAKTSYKIITIGIAIVGLVYLYNNQYFDLLEYRIMEDETGGSGRADIWNAKINAFSRGDAFHFIFGYGYYDAMTITGRNIGFHNEYVGFLVEYGVFGLLLLLYMLFSPLKFASRKNMDVNNRVKVYAVVVYLAMCFMTLEPLGLGIFTFFAFYFYGFLLATKKSEEIMIVNETN